MKKKEKKKTSTYWRKKCVARAKKLAKERDGYVCQHCGATREQGWQMHGSHIKPEGVYVSMSADVDNILCLCARCHKLSSKGRPSWHDDPLYFGEWFKKNYPKLARELTVRAQTTKEKDWEKEWKKLSLDVPQD